MAEPTIDDINAAIASKSKPSLDDINQAIAEKQGPSLAQRALGYVSTGAKALGSVTGDPTRAAVSAAASGQNPFSAFKYQFGNMEDKAPSGTDIAKQMGISDERPTPYQSKYGLPEYDKSRSHADIVGSAIDLAANPLNVAGPFLSKVSGKIGPLVESLANKPTAEAIKTAASRLGFSASPGMLSDSPVVQGLEDTLSQSPSITGAITRHAIKPIAKGLKDAAEDLVSGAPAISTSAYKAGGDAQGGVMAALGERANNIKMAYEPFNQDLPKMIPQAEDKWKLADQINKIVENHKGRADLSQLGRSFSNGVMESDHLGDIEDLRKSLGNELSTEYKAVNPDYNVINTMTKIKDKLSDFRDTQFQTLAKQAYPGPGGANIGPQMISDYQNAMGQHAALMGDLKDVGPIFGIKAQNPKDFIEAFSEIPPEQIAKKLFSTNNYNALQKVQAYFPDEFNTIKGLKMQELRQASLSNPVDPSSEIVPHKLVLKINKMTPEVRQVLFGDKMEKLKDMQTVLGSFPEHIGPSGTPKGEMFTHMADPVQQLRDVGNYAAYKALGSKTGSKVLTAIPKVLSSVPSAAGPISSAILPGLQGTENNNTQGYWGGGTVQNPPPPPTNIDPQKAKEVQDSMRKAFHFSDGGTVPPAPWWNPQGSNLAKSIAQAGHGHAHGGAVPIDSPEKDTSLIAATPGEVVLPLSVTKSPNAPQKAKEFMANEMQGGQQPQDPAQAQLIQQAQNPSPKEPMDPQKGPEKWAFDGFQNLMQHAPDEMKTWLHENKTALLLDPKAKNLLITASSFRPGSKPLNDVIKHLQTRFGGKK